MRAAELQSPLRQQGHLILNAPSECSILLFLVYMVIDMIHAVAVIPCALGTIAELQIRGISVGASANGAFVVYEAMLVLILQQHGAVRSGVFKGA